MADKSIMIDMQDPRADKIAEVITNATCKKILALLADSEMSETEISQKLKIPLNTVGYNIKKLTDAGLIEKSESFFWSVKGKRVPKYRVSTKKIIISPKESFKGIIPSMVITGLVALGIRSFAQTEEAGSAAVQRVASESTALAYEKSAGLATDLAINAPSSGATDIYYAVVNSAHSWAWFMFGALAAMVIFLLWNWRKVW